MLLNKNFENNLNESYNEIYNELANTTKMGDAVSPITGKKFSETFVMSENANGQAMITVFPWNDKVAVASNSWAGITALTDGFGLLRYMILEKDNHVRNFDPSSLVERNVRAAKSGNGIWTRYDWVDGSWKAGYSNEPKWINKHTELNLLYRAATEGFRYNIVLLEQGMKDKVERNIIGRMDLTIVEALKLKGEDWKVAKEYGELRKAGVQVPDLATEPVALVVGGVTLTGPTKLFVKTPTSSELMPLLFDPTIPGSIKRVQALLAKKAFQVTIA